MTESAKRSGRVIDEGVMAIVTFATGATMVGVRRSWTPCLAVPQTLKGAARVNAPGQQFDSAPTTSGVQ